MQFVLTGFRQDNGFRVFAFEGIGQDRSRTLFTVKTDLALTRRYGIHLQELPLLCRELLDKRDAARDASAVASDGVTSVIDERRTFTYTEEDMCLHAKCQEAARDAAIRKRKPPRPHTENAGSAWRAPQQ